MDRRKLHDDISRIVINNLYVRDVGYRYAMVNSEEEAIKKYLNNNVFHAQVKSLVAQIMIAVDEERERGD